MEYLQYQLHASASTLAIIRLAFNLSRDYTICMVYFWEAGDLVPFPPPLEVHHTDCMEYLHYQLHVSASTLAIIRLAFNLSRDYIICMV